MLSFVCFSTKDFARSVVIMMSIKMTVEAADSVADKFDCCVSVFFFFLSMYVRLITSNATDLRLSFGLYRKHRYV